MWEGLHILLGESRSFPGLDPRPCLDVGDAVFAFALASEVVAWLTGVFTGQLDLKNSIDTEGLILVAVDCV
jgi:hypothetical protein